MYVCRIDMYILRGWPGRLAGLAEKGKKKTEVEKCVSVVSGLFEVSYVLYMRSLFMRGGRGRGPQTRHIHM